MRKVIGWSAIALVALIAVLLVILLLVDITVYRGPLQSGVSAFLGRSVRFEGAMSLRPSLWPNIVVADVGELEDELGGGAVVSLAATVVLLVSLLQAAATNMKVAATTRTRLDMISL